MAILSALISAGKGIRAVITVGAIVVSAAPTLSLVATAGGAVGDIDGGYTATFTGTNFVIGATTVTFGGAAATSVVVSSPTALTCTVPAHATGAVSVIVTTAGGSNPANSLFRFFSPAERACSMWIRPDYSASPWLGTASAGASAGRTISNGAFTPTPGTAIHGHIPAVFTPISYMECSVNNNVLFGTSGTIFVLFYGVTAPAPSGTDYADGTFLGDNTDAETTFGFTTSGISACVFDGVPKRINVACGTGAWHLAQIKWDGTNLRARVDGGAWTSLACGNALFPTPSIPTVGRSYGGTYLDSIIGEIITVAATESDATCDDVRSYCSTRYSLTV